MRYFIFFLFVLFSFNTNTIAQELICNVRVEAPNLTKVDPSVMQILESDISQFMNNRQWTDVRYNNNAKIECSMNINITDELSSTRFKAEVTIQANRPVYNSNYKTILFQYKDIDWEFDYNQGQALDFENNAYISNLTAFLGFYAFTIIGYDYDSFTNEGGTPYFQKAEQIVNNARVAADAGPGWKPDESRRRNRYWMVENILNPRFRSLRNAYYTYHREGLDKMYDDIDEARAGIMEALQKLEKSHKDNPNTMAIKIFTVSKSAEIIDIFSDPTVRPTEKVKVSNIMSKVDPSSASKYSKINKITNKAGRAADNRGNSVEPRRGGR